MTRSGDGGPEVIAACAYARRETGVAAWPSTGSITDEGVARLRARIGIPEPHPMPPHYTLPTRRHVPQRRGRLRRRQPAVVRSRLRRRRRAGRAPIAPPALVGGDTLIGEDEVTAVAPEHRDLMKGDPLRGVHAFYAASAREWWAPLRPAAARRSAATRSSPRSTSRASSPGGRSTSGPRRCSATTTARCSPGQYRLMVRTEREKARERKKYDAVELAPYTDEQIDEIDAQYARERPARRRAALVGGRRARATRSARW